MFQKKEQVIVTITYKQLLFFKVEILSTFTLRTKKKYCHQYYRYTEYENLTLVLSTPHKKILDPPLSWMTDKHV